MKSRHGACWLCLFYVLLLITAPVYAGTLYRYQSADGQWFFTDRPLENENLISETPLEADPEPQNAAPYGIRIERQADGLFIRAYNNLGGPLYFQLRHSGDKPLLTYPELPFDQTVQSGSLDNLAQFLAPPETLDGLHYRVILGDPEAVHRPDTPYRLPFLPGEEYLVSQGFNGSFSHNHDGSRYAVDIAMPEGSIVCAVRSGTVMEVEFGNYQGGVDAEEFGSKANFVRILHEDGTIATYAHLQLETVRVEIGETVEAGQIIARSGNTGFSTGPHLHLVIHKNDGFKLVSVPFEFESGIPYRGQILRFE